MKNNKTTLGLLFLAAITFALTLTTPAAVTQLIYGPAFITNTITVGTSNFQYGVVVQLYTNYYNLSQSYGNQTDTNRWPAAGVSFEGYPNTQNGPSRIQGIYCYMPTYPASNSVHQVVFAGSVDGGTAWVSNALTLTVTSGIPLYTNWDSGALPYLALQSIANPNQASVVTNMVIEVARKPGI